MTLVEHALVVRMTGTADLRVTETVEKLLTTVHQQAAAGPVSEVKVDLRGLEFMNSSCFKTALSCFAAHWITLDSTSN
ncbi:MAG: hypothetical protein ABW061_07455 [Polyangiaceae bacterium]